MTDPIKEALAEVEAGADHDRADDPGAGVGEIGEEPEARPEGPAPDSEMWDETDEEAEGGFSVLSWAQSVPDGSHRDFDASDWWDPEHGGENRIAFHLSEATGAGAGYPNGLGLAVGLAEMYWSAVRSSTKDEPADEQESEASAGDTVARETAEAYV